MLRPTAMVIGPMKAGTTWIHRYLDARGDVRLPGQMKETFFFDRYSDRGMRWYCGHFATWKGKEPVQTVETAPSLFHHPEAPDRIREALGAIPIVVTTRDPIARSWSHYLHLRRYGYTRKPLREAVGDFPEILEASRYDRIIAHWKSKLPESPIVSLRLEELSANPEAYVRKLCSALSLPYRPVPEGLEGREFAAAAPPSFAIARFARNLSSSLRSADLHAVLNLARRLGLREVVYGSSGNGLRVAKPAKAELDWLGEQLREGEPLWESRPSDRLSARSRDSGGALSTTTPSPG